MGPPAHSRESEEPLAGGNVSAVSRVGDTVRRGTGPWTPAVHTLLRHLERVGFDGAPRVLGTDERGREVLSYVPGVTPDHASPEGVTERVLDEVGRLLRRYHEAARGFELPAGVSWQYPELQGVGTVVCHNDVSPRNTVFQGGLPVAFLDWDLALRQRRLDFAAGPGPTAAYPVRRIQVAAPRAREFLGVVVSRMETTASGIEDLAAGGSPAHERLVSEGVPALVREDKAWVERNAGWLDAALLKSAPGG